MSARVRILLLAVTVGVVAMIVRWMGQSSASPRSPRQEKQATGDSVARYATDEFVAACRVRPKELIKHAYFGSLPIDRFLPAPLSLGRLDEMDVEEWAAPKGSYSLSVRLVNPEMPPPLRNVGIRSRRPVRILCG